MSAQTVSPGGGGLDSTVLAYSLARGGYKVGALSVLYGQRNWFEVGRARQTAQELGFVHRTVDMKDAQGLLRSALTSSRSHIPEGHYEDPKMVANIIPNRNMILLSLGLAWAASEAAGSVYFATARGARAIYPDCRPPFIEAMDAAARLCHTRELRVIAPFMNKTKAEIVAIGAELGAPFAETWSCYAGGKRHCGRCAACYGRREAFRVAGIDDPTEYEEAR